MDVTVGIGAEHVFAVEGHFALVGLGWVACLEHVVEVFGRSAHDAGVLEVFEDGGVEFDGFRAMCGAEVDVVVYHCLAALCVVKKLLDA